VILLLVDFFEQIKFALLKVWSWIMVVFYFLVEPNQQFIAVWVAFMFSFVSKIMEIIANDDMEFSNSVALRKGTKTIIAYFILTSMAYHSEAVLPAISSWVYTTIYSFIFSKELLNITKHLAGAGIDVIPLSQSLRKKISTEIMNIDLGGVNNEKKSKNKQNDK
jgi:hypothetical protein